MTVHARRCLSPTRLAQRRTAATVATSVLLAIMALADAPAGADWHPPVGPGGDAVAAWISRSTPDDVHATVQSAHASRGRGVAGT